jgi:phage gpG-like protein
MAGPKSSDIIRSVQRGLRLRSDLSPAIVPDVHFEPTLGITAARIDKLGVDIRSFREPLLASVREVMVPSIRRNFDEGGRPAWEPLSDVTVKIRGTAGPILNRTGTLRSVATQINIWTITRTSAVIRDLPQKAWYGKVHQAGSGGSMKALVLKNKGDVGAASREYQYLARQGVGHDEGEVPARPFLMIQPEDDVKIRELFLEWLAMRVGAAFGTAL